VKKPVKDLPHLIFDYEELLARVENDRELLRDLLTIFREEFPHQLSRLTRSCGSKKWKRVAAAAHALRGMLSNLAATQAPPQRHDSSRWAARKKLRDSRGLHRLRERCQPAPAAVGRLHGRGVQVRILIADDEAMSRRLLQITLERAAMR